MKSSGIALKWLPWVVGGGLFSVWMIFEISMLFTPRLRPKVYGIENSMRTVATGLESYLLDHGGYPRPVASTSGWTVLPPVLTTPVAYLAKLPESPFLSKGETFGYAFVADDEEAWGSLAANLSFEPTYVLLSPGPSRERGPFRLDWTMVYDPTNGTKSPGYMVRFGVGRTMEETARSSQILHDHATDDTSGAFTYDPTNGAITRCERWKVKQ